MAKNAALALKNSEVSSSTSLKSPQLQTRVTVMKNKQKMRTLSWIEISWIRRLYYSGFRICSIDAFEEGY